MMSVEAWMLLGAMVLGLVHVGASSMAFKAQVGNDYTNGPRDEGVVRQGVAGRLDRAQRNFLETFGIFAAAVLLLEVQGRSGMALSQWGAGIYLVGRILYLPLYAAGIPQVRSAVWAAATLGLVLVMAAVAFGG